MERWTEIRRNVLTGAMSKREACRHYDIHWLTLKKILAHEEPPGSRRGRPPRRPKVDPVLPIIQAILDADTTAPKKQRHTAHRIWQRLRDEHAFRGGYTVVKDAVRELRAGRQEVFLPLAHPPGEAQVDFGFAQVVLGGVTTEVALFVLSLPYADAVYCQAFPRNAPRSSWRGMPGPSCSSAACPGGSPTTTPRQRWPAGNMASVSRVGPTSSLWQTPLA